MPMRRLACFAAAVTLVAACSRSKNADSDSTGGDSAAVAAAGSQQMSTLSATSDPPPPPIDTNATLSITGTTTTATTDSSQTQVRFHYDTAGGGYKATLDTTRRDSVTVDPGTAIQGSDSTLTGTGRITGRTATGRYVIDVSRIARGSSLGHCQANPPAGQGRCGTVMFDSVQFTPNGGQPTRRYRARLELGH